MYVSKSIRPFSLFFGVIVVAILASSSAFGQSTVPRLISHQGLLTDPSTGEPVPDASYSITFRLYGSSSGGTSVWSETQSVTTESGIFNANLGSVASLDSVSFSDELWLSLQVSPDPEMTDRIELTSVPYALGLALPFSDTVSSDSPLLHLNNSGTSDGILVTNTGSGTAGAFVQQDPTSSFSGVYGQSDGLGEAVLGYQFGTGIAGRFAVMNGSSKSPALQVETDGSGPAALIKDGRAEIEYNSSLGDPHVLVRETGAGDYARISLRNDDNTLYWDIAAGGAGNTELNFFRSGPGDILTLRSSGRVGIGTVAPDERLHVDGVIKADSIVYSSPLSEWTSIHGSSFGPFEQDGTIQYQRSNSGFHFKGGVATTAYAQIQFPDHAVLQELSCRLNDATTSENLVCRLCRENGTGCLIIGDVTSDDVSGGTASYTTSLPAFTVDNENYSYFVTVYTEGGTSWSNYFAQLRMVGASVRYTVGGAP